MKALLQRVSQAEVSVDDAVIARIGPGLLVFLCVEDGVGQGRSRAAGAQGRELTHLRRRRRPDEPVGPRHRRRRAGGQPVHPGRRLAQGQPPQLLRRRRARPGPQALYKHFCTRLREQRVPVQTGRFAAAMAVRLVNDGPVTIWMDTRDR